MRKQSIRLIWELLAGALLLGAALSACDVPKTMPDAGLVFDLTVDLAPPSCNATPSFATIKSNILPQCNGSDGCHRTAPFAAGLDLTDASAYGSLVNAPAQNAPGLLRVQPGIPKDSFLWRKLDNELPPNAAQGQPMPLGAEFIWTPLNAAQRAQVYCWIQAGALNN